MPPTERIHYLQQLQSQLDDSIIELSTRTARTKQYLETLDGWEKRSVTALFDRIMILGIYLFAALLQVDTD